MKAPLHLILTLAVFAVSAPLAAAESQPKTVVKTEHFDRDPGWEGRNNRLTRKELSRVVQDFGFSASNHAGKESGEIGGSITRSITPAWYADRIAPKTLNDKLTASGSSSCRRSGRKGRCI